MIPNSDKLSPYLHYFFTAYLPQQRGASLHTRLSYKHTFLQLLRYWKSRFPASPDPRLISSRALAARLPGPSGEGSRQHRFDAQYPSGGVSHLDLPPSFPCSRLEKREVCLDSAGAVIEGNLWRRLVLPKRIDNWSLTSLQQRLVKTGGRLVKHARYYWLLLTESHLMTRRLCGAMLGRITRLPVPTG